MPSRLFRSILLALAGTAVLGAEATLRGQTTGESGRSFKRFPVGQASLEDEEPPAGRIRLPAFIRHRDPVAREASALPSPPPPEPASGRPRGAWTTLSESSEPDEPTRGSRRSRAYAMPHGPEPLPVHDDVLTLDALQRLALQYNPTLAQARSLVRKADGQVVQSGLYPNPTAGYQANEVGNEGKAGQQGYFIEQEFVTAGKLGLSRSVAAQERRRTYYVWKAQETRVLSAVRQEYFAVLVALRTEELSTDLVEIADQAVRTTDARLKRGEGTKLDVVQARIEVEGARQTLIRAENERYAASKRLAAVVGLCNLDCGLVAGDLATGFPDLSFDGVWERICAASPQLAAARADVRRAQAAVNRARVEPVPNIIAQGAHGYDANTEYHIANAQIGVAIPVFNRNQGNIYTAEAETVRAAREVLRLEQSLRRRLADVFRQYATAIAQSERYRDEILPAAQESLQMSRTLYEAGEINYLQLQQVQRTYTQTNLQYVSVLGELWESVVALEGLLLVDGLASPESLEVDGR